MIIGQFHEGSGLGDQLFRYITVRSTALDRGLEWGMFGSFKGHSFMQIEPYSRYSPEIDFPYQKWTEREVRDANGVDVRSYDPEINFIDDQTFIDGCFEDDKYWGHHIGEIDSWLNVEKLTVPDSTCVIGFRGGEYASIPDLYLKPEYWREAIAQMRHRNKDFKFEIHTDDPERARRTFPDFSVIENEEIAHSLHTNMGLNWRTMRNAKYAIIPNSAFYIIPRLLKHQEDPSAITIAPRGWSRRNAQDGTWGRPACFYKQFLYI